LFVHGGSTAYVALDDAQQNLVWVTGSSRTQTIPKEWFDRAHRLLTLSRWTGIDLISADLVLRQLCGNRLDAAALRRLAVVVDLRDGTGAPIDVLCSLLADLDDASATLGASDDPLTPASLFDRVYNGAPARLAKSYLPSGTSGANF